MTAMCLSEHDYLRLVNREHDYAGTTDAAAVAKLRGKCIIDFKSRKTKVGEEVKSWPEQPMQIAAYHVAHFKETPRAGEFLAGVNVYISTTEPGRLEAVWYDAAQLEREWVAFQSACSLWRHLKGYDPR